RNNAHGDRHEAMILTAKLRALTVIKAFLVSLEPGFVDTSRNGIHLHAESRDRPRMDHIGSGNKEANRFTDRNHDFVIDGEKTRITRTVFLTGSGPITVLQKKGIRAYLIVDLIRIAPRPLVPRRLDGQRRIFRRILRRQELEG